MAAISKTAFSNAFSWIIILYFNSNINEDFAKGPTDNNGLTSNTSASHYLNPCWPSSLTHIPSTRGDELIFAWLWSLDLDIHYSVNIIAFLNILPHKILPAHFEYNILSGLETRDCISQRVWVTYFHRSIYPTTWNARDIYRQNELTVKCVGKLLQLHPSQVPCCKSLENRATVSSASRDF